MPIWCKTKSALSRSASTDSAAAGGCRECAASGIPRYLQYLSPPSPTLSIQRQSEGELPNPLQLTPPSLLQPRRPYPNLRLAPELELRLSPEVQAMALDSVRTWLSPGFLSDAIGRVDFSALDQPAPVFNPFALPAVPAPPPLVPRGAGPSVPRSAGGGELARAALAVPMFRSGLDHLGDFASERVRRDWDRLGTGGQVGLVTWMTIIGGGALAGVISDPDARSFALSQLNGRVLPVPGLDWLHLELYTGGSSLMVGTHVDVGRILQLTVPQLGFGPSSPSAIGGPPQPQPFVPGPPIERAAAEGGAAQPSPHTTERIRWAARRGSALPPMLRGRLEHALDADLGEVRVHHDADSDALARDLRAHAFTTGQDIFFRAGRYAPESGSGRRLLAHELAHTVQQAQGRVPGGNAQGGMQVGPVDDPMEREADRFADGVADVDLNRGRGAPHSAGSAATPPPAIQRQPEAASGKPQPRTAAQAAKLGPPAWTDYFDEVVPAILEAVESSGKVGIDRALWLIVQAYGEQSPGATGRPSQHRNRLFNEQAAVVRDPRTQKITGVVPGQEKEGVYLYNLPQNEAPERGKQEIKSSPTFGYDTPERAAGHHLESMESRWGSAWNALTDKNGSFESFARGLKAAGYARANDYDTALIALQGQVRREVTNWIKFRLPEMRQRATAMESYIDFLRDERGSWQRMVREGDPTGSRQQQVDQMAALIAAAEKDLQDLRARTGRLERFAAALKVKVGATQ